MRFYAMLDTDEIRYLGDWDDKVYGSAFDEAAEAADKIKGASYHWILDEDGLAKMMRTARNAALLDRSQPGRAVDADEFVASFSSCYELRMPTDDKFLYVRLVDMRRAPNDREIVYWEEKEFDDIESVLPALFGAIQRAVYHWGFREIGIE